MDQVDRTRAELFASTVFPACASCRSEAAEVHIALEALAGKQLENLDPDTGIREILRPVLENLRLSRHASEMDSLDVVEFLMSVEEERGGEVGRDEFARLLEETTSEGVFKKLLGPFVEVSTWDQRTVWLRSIRGVINERSVHRGGCSCPVRASLPKQ